MNIFTKQQIENSIPDLKDLMLALESGYIAYSQEGCVIPPVGYLPLPHGELHIKYGMLKDSKYATIKIAAGSYNNSKLGLPSSSGCMMMIDTETGFPVALLQDEGLLTDYRTSAVGALIAKRFAPNAEVFGIIGCGIQGYYQTLHTTQATGIKQVIAYDQTPEAIAVLQKKLSAVDIEVRVAESVEELCRNADIITTVTPSKEAYLDAQWLKPNTHINAFGCDSAGKRELCENVFDRASIIVADSIQQCTDHGELQYADEKTKASVIEIGNILTQDTSNLDGVSVADFTGIAVQDIVINELVYKILST